MNNILGQIKAINPNSPCLNFLVARLQSDNYRGNHISQHNRFNKNTILIILKEIYDIAGTNLLQIRTEDLSKRPNNIEGEEKYAELVNNIALELNRCTQDSLRKNIFVDMHRMGLINRYNGNGVLIAAFAKSKTIKYISIASLGLSILEEQDQHKQNMLYQQTLYSLMGDDFWSEFYSLMAEIEHISLYEYVLFGSFLNKSLNGLCYSRDSIVYFINEFRDMDKNSQNNIIDMCEQYCNPNNFEGDKITKRDWHNLKNETMQIFNILMQTKFFDYRQTDLVYIFN